jgi:ATP-dependent Clp protease ATP-binding subunit ClpC
MGFTPRRDGVGAEKSQYELMKEKVMTEVRKVFRPEFLNRIDDIIVFHELDEPQLETIVTLMTQDLQKRLEDRRITLSITEAARAYLVKVGYDPAYGARPLRRALEQYIENPLAARLLSGEVKEGDSVVVDHSSEGLVFQTSIEAGS